MSHIVTLQSKNMKANLEGKILEKKKVRIKPQYKHHYDNKE